MLIREPGRRSASSHAGCSSPSPVRRRSTPASRTAGTCAGAPEPPPVGDPGDERRRRRELDAERDVVGDRAGGRSCAARPRRCRPRPGSRRPRGAAAGTPSRSRAGPPTRRAVGAAQPEQLGDRRAGAEDRHVEQHDRVHQAVGHRLAARAVGEQPVLPVGHPVVPPGNRWPTSAASSSSVIVRSRAAPASRPDQHEFGELVGQHVGRAVALVDPPQRHQVEHADDRVRPRLGDGRVVAAARAPVGEQFGQRFGGAAGEVQRALGGVVGRAAGDVEEQFTVVRRSSRGWCGRTLRGDRGRERLAAARSRRRPRR